MFSEVGAARGSRRESEALQVAASGHAVHMRGRSNLPSGCTRPPHTNQHPRVPGPIHLLGVPWLVTP
jgi:hypothetical protein